MTSLIDTIKSLATLGNVVLLLGSLGGLYAFYIKIKNGIYQVKEDIDTGKVDAVNNTIATTETKIETDTEAYNAALAKFNSDSKPTNSGS